MSKHLKRMLDRRDRARGGIVDLFNTARHDGLSHSEMCKRRDDIYQRCKINHSPEWVSQYLHGYWDCLSQQLYRNDLVFGGMVDGQFYSTHSDRSDYYEKSGITPSELYADDGRVTERGHYWTETMKPYFIGCQVRS